MESKQRLIFYKKALVIARREGTIDLALLYAETILTIYWQTLEASTEAFFEINLTLGELFIEKNDHSEALIYLKKAQSLQDDEYVTFWVGYCQYNLGQYSHALQSFNVALEYTLEDNLINYYRGLSYLFTHKNYSALLELSHAYFKDNREFALDIIVKRSQAVSGEYWMLTSHLFIGTLLGMAENYEEGLSYLNISQSLIQKQRFLSEEQQLSLHCYIHYYKAEFLKGHNKLLEAHCILYNLKDVPFLPVLDFQPSREEVFFAYINNFWDCFQEQLLTLSQCKTLFYEDFERMDSLWNDHELCDEFKLDIFKRMSHFLIEFKDFTNLKQIVKCLRKQYPSHPDTLLIEHLRMKYDSSLSLKVKLRFYTNLGQSKLMPTGMKLENIYDLLGQLYINSNQIDQAIDIYEQIYNMDIPFVERTRYLYKKYYLYIQQHRFEEVIQYFELTEKDEEEYRNYFDPEIFQFYEYYLKVSYLMQHRPFTPFEYRSPPTESLCNTLPKKKWPWPIMLTSLN